LKDPKGESPVRANRSAILAGAVVAAAIVAVGADAGAQFPGPNQNPPNPQGPNAMVIPRIVPGFAGVIKSPSSQANWGNAYEELSHTGPSTDGVAYNLPIDPTQGYVWANLWGWLLGPGSHLCAQLLAVNGDDVWQSGVACDWDSLSGWAAQVYMPGDGWAAVEVSATGSTEIDAVRYQPW
jgi:hypothetical protein